MIAAPAIAGALFAVTGRGTAVLVVAALPAALAVAAALVRTGTRGMASPTFEVD